MLLQQFPEIYKKRNSSLSPVMVASLGSGFVGFLTLPFLKSFLSYISKISSFITYGRLLTIAANTTKYLKS